MKVWIDGLQGADQVKPEACSSHRTRCLHRRNMAFGNAGNACFTGLPAEFHSKGRTFPGSPQLTAHCRNPASAISMIWRGARGRTLPGAATCYRLCSCCCWCCWQRSVGTRRVVGRVPQPSRSAVGAKSSPGAAPGAGWVPGCQGARTLMPPSPLAALAKSSSKLMKASQPSAFAR
jgi:hypothetical protein